MFKIHKRLKGLLHDLALVNFSCILYLLNHSPQLITTQPCSLAYNFSKKPSPCSPQAFLIRVPAPWEQHFPFPPSSSFQYHFFTSLKLQLKPHFSPDIFLSNLVFTDRPFLQNSIIWQVNNLVLYSVPTYIVSWLLHTSHQSSSVHRVLRTDK